MLRRGSTINRCRSPFFLPLLSTKKTVLNTFNKVTAGGGEDLVKERGFKRRTRTRPITKATKLVWLVAP